MLRMLRSRFLLACSSALLLPVYGFYHSILSLSHSWRKILLAYCYSNNTLYQFSKCLCCSSACVRFFATPTFPNCPPSNTTRMYFQHTHMNEAELSAQNTSSNLRTFTFTFKWKTHKVWKAETYSDKICYTFVIFVHLYVTAMWLQSTNVDESTGEEFDNRWKSFANSYMWQVIEKGLIAKKIISSVLKTQCAKCWFHCVLYWILFHFDDLFRINNNTTKLDRLNLVYAVHINSCTLKGVYWYFGYDAAIKSQIT